MMALSKLKSEISHFPEGVEGSGNRNLNRRFKKKLFPFFGSVIFVWRGGTRCAPRPAQSKVSLRH